MVAMVRVHETGGPEVLRFEEVEVGEPGPGQVRLRQSAVGLNFIDVYFRTGLYPAPGLPFTPGQEGSGVVEAVGDGVSEVKVGDRVAYAPVLGAYAEARLIPANRLVALPDGISDKQAAAMMLKGMTAEYLLRRTFPVKAGQTILFHAAAGGVGLIACQWAKHLGARLRFSDPLRPRRRGRVGARAHRRQGCVGGLRFGRQEHLRAVARLSGALRHVGDLRPILG
jgi:NADPH:quinone reductase